MCLEGTYCNGVGCVVDECRDEECTEGQICLQGRCQNDPCRDIQCPPYQQCRVFDGDGDLSRPQCIQNWVQTESAPDENDEDQLEDGLRGGMDGTDTQSDGMPSGGMPGGALIMNQNETAGGFMGGVSPNTESLSMDEMTQMKAPSSEGCHTLSMSSQVTHFSYEIWIIFLLGLRVWSRFSTPVKNNSIKVDHHVI